MAMLDGDQLETDDAATLADILAILADVEQSNRAANLLVSGNHDPQVTVSRALYESALISYRRALVNRATRISGSGGRERWRIPSEDFNKVIGDQTDEQKEILRVADKCVAHCTIPDARRVEVVENEPAGEPMAQTKYKQRNDLMPDLADITGRLQEYLFAKASEYAKRIRCQTPNRNRVN